jgi:hypothetical protein
MIRSEERKRKSRSGREKERKRGKRMGNRNFFINYLKPIFN